MFAPKKAEKPQIKIKCLLCGISGSGKTYSALLMAKEWVKGDMSKVILLNNEGERGLLHATPDSPFYGYHYFDVQPPYSPEKYTQLIKEIQKTGAYECIIIDSITEEWNYLLEEKTRAETDKASKENSFTVWGRLKPLHDTMLNVIISANIHIICTCKLKTKYAVEQVTNAQGFSKSVPKQIGEAPIQSDTIKYPFFSCLSLSSKGFRVTEDKNNSEIFEHGKSRLLDTTLANDFLNWANAGVTRVDYYAANIEYITAILDKVNELHPTKYDATNETLLKAQYDNEKIQKLILDYKAKLGL